MNFSWN